MFRTAFPSIIRSSRLHIQQQAFVKQILLLLAYVKQILLLLASNQQQYLTYACCCMYSRELLMMDGRTVRNM